MASKVTIANLVLIQLGEAPIVSFNEGSESANRISILFPEAVRTVLSHAQNGWSFAIERAELAALVDTPLYGFNYQFQIPVDNIKLLEINDDSLKEKAFRVEGSKLLFNDSTVKIKYTKYIEDTGSFNEFFKNALVEYLIYQLSYTIVSSIEARQSQYRVYQQVLRDSLMQDQTLRNARDNIADDLIEVRSDGLELPE